MAKALPEAVSPVTEPVAPAVIFGPSVVTPSGSRFTGGGPSPPGVAGGPPPPGGAGGPPPPDPPSAMRPPSIQVDLVGLQINLLALDHDVAVPGSASISSQLGSFSGQQGMTSTDGRSGYFDGSVSGSVMRTPDSISGSANASVKGGLLTSQGTSTLPGGLGSTSTSGSVMSGEAEAGATFKLSREEATLSGKLGAGAALYEVQAKGQLILTPQRVYNGVVVNGVNAFLEWRGYETRMKEIQNAKLDHGIVLSGNVGLHVGPAAKADGHIGYKQGKAHQLAAR